MRIIAGQWRGRRIEAPRGDTARPTIDRVRESLMSVLASARGTLEGAVVLDAFAGSGALGLEALSRGAAYVWFFERDRAVYRTLSSNIAQFGLTDACAHARCADTLAAIPHPPRPFDLVLLDPPYRIEATAVYDLLDRLHDAGALSPNVIVSYEHAAARDASPEAAGDAQAWRTLSRKKYGNVSIDIIVRADGAHANEGM